MKNYSSVFIFIINAIAFSIEAYSGGRLSKYQAAMDVQHYDLNIKVDPYREIITGVVNITFNLLKSCDYLEIDLLKTFAVSGVSINGISLGFEHKEHKVYIKNPGLTLLNDHILEIKYGGSPPVAKRPPWDGGFTWDTSDDGMPWVGVSCQSNGAYIWYPCKEHPSDKSNGADIKVTVPDPLQVVSNGLLKSKSQNNKWTTWHWETNYPISTYNINFTIGNFETIRKTGYILDKSLELVYYVLPEANNDNAIELLQRAEEYLNFYAKYFGQYPWIEEKFGLVHAPYWGMEHQTINAYGNNYKKTKLGYDFILFHEMGHEWWGNFISVSDWSDFWIHEGFDTYAEVVFIEEKYGKKNAINFVKNRLKKNIKNEFPIVGLKNGTTNQKAGNDIYYKGAHVLHTLRYLIGDHVFLSSLKEYIIMPKVLPQNQTSTDEFISLIHENSKTDLNWFFNLYLYDGDLPTLNIQENILGNKKYIDYWWQNKDFKIPLQIEYQSFDGKRRRTIELNNSPYRIAINSNSSVKIDPDGWVLFEKNFIR